MDQSENSASPAPQPACRQLRYCRILFNASLGLKDAFCDQADRAVEKISEVLARPAPCGITIRLVDQPRRSIASYDTATALISRVKLPHRANLVHELTHIIAGRSWSRLLEEGLAVFMQEKFGGPDDQSFPAEGRDLHQETANTRAVLGLLLPLSAELHFQPRQMRSLPRRLAYLQAGSFIRFLAERNGLAKVLQLYAGARWEDAFGERLDAIETQWRSALPAPRIAPASQPGPAPSRRAQDAGR